MTHELPSRRGSGLPKRKPFLLVLIIGLGALLFSVLVRLHNIAASAFGYDMAVVVVAAATIVILFLILLGMGFGGGLEWAISKRILLFKRKPAPGSWLDQFLRLWGNRLEDPEPRPQQNETSSDDMPPGITMKDIEELLVIIGQRRRGGKKSLHSDEVQFRAVRDWMIMQSRGTSVTLLQFLEERFGVASETGMALVPNQTFYGWRKKFLEELEKNKQTQTK
ncbi:MAG: hypothetical protein HZB50_03675 [Chloroflexi bacterium]|nr:hypothetical protein [Chloroflexota bacterium]